VTGRKEECEEWRAIKENRREQLAGHVNDFGPFAGH